MQQSKSVPSLKIPLWVKSELNTGVDRQIRAKEIGKHHKRLNEQRADIDNIPPQNTVHYLQLRQRLFTLQQQQQNKKIENNNIELLRHLITLSQDAPNYRTYPKSSHSKFVQRMSKLTRTRREKQIEIENKKLKHRLNSIKPSKSLKAINMAKDFKIHKKLQKQFLSTHNIKRKQPDVIEYTRPKLTKKERTRFMQPLKRSHANNRPMTPNTWSYKQNRNRNYCKGRNIQSARRNITDAFTNRKSAQTDRSHYRNSKKQSLKKNKNGRSSHIRCKSARGSMPNVVHSKGMRMSSSKYSMHTTSPLDVNSPSYVLRASKIYDHKHALSPKFKRNNHR
eukprot:321469_1